MNLRTPFKWLSRGTIIAASTLVLSGAVGSPPAIPEIDLSIGPVAVKAQAVNIALALSVEWPTIGSAYRDSGYTYSHTKEYVGYWDHKSCYEYRDPTPGAPLAGEYFYRTGAVDTNGYCNTGGNSGWSGNVMNYVATSSIDLLRLALTGGNRVADDTNYTVLERAYLWGDRTLNDPQFRSRRIPAALRGKVTPLLAGTGDVWGGSCHDKIWFGSGVNTNACNNPGPHGDLSANVVDLGSTTTVVVPTGDPAPTAPPGGTVVFVATTWSITSGTTTVMPTAGPIVSFDYTMLGSGTSTVAPPGHPVADTYLYSNWVPNGTTTVAPVSPEPVVVLGTQDVPRAVRVFYTVPQANPQRSFSFDEGGINVCTSTDSNKPPNFAGVLNSGGVIVSVPDNGSCGTGAYAGYPFRNGIAGSDRPRTVYEPQDSKTVYRSHTEQKVYKSYTTETAYYVHLKNKDEYQVTGLKPAPFAARVRVCHGAEATSRTDLCHRYPAGNYKPIGEIQRNAEGSRVAAFGYLAEDGNGRNGGVLRAPMHFPGPEYRDEEGVLQTNAQPEWEASTGIFIKDPLGVSPAFPMSGVINYLNKFGTTGNVGKYKGNDPVGELYYEALRYFQGLPPTPSSISSLANASYDGFPVYGTTAESPKTLAGWTDPIQNSCQRRNFILTIGDVNTHRDRNLPGHGSGASSALVTGDQPARAAEPLKGDASKTLNTAEWTALITGFETGVSRSYVDALGRTQDTLGNPNARAANSNLEGKSTGADAGAYYWAGAAYWANTQPIRWDTKDGKSMKDVRVKTFTIDVDENGNGDIEDTNTRGIKPRSSAAFLAGKYGWFNDANLDGNPFKTAGGAVNNSEWEAGTAPNTPEGYVIASQAQKLLNGIKQFFKAASSERGSVSVSSLSSQRFTAQEPNGDLFSPRYDSRDWSGTVQRSSLKFNTTTGKIDAKVGVTWDAGKILTTASTSAATLTDPYVKPADRKIFTQSRGVSATSGQAFTVANKGNLDPEVVAALNKNPATAAVDGLSDERINWIRGERSQEQGAGGPLRHRVNIMGDVINSGPVFKQGADPETLGPGYSQFAASVASRVAMVYVGANDGMLHAFRANDGKELFAYIPRAVAEHVNKLTHPDYAHRPYVDGVPVVTEAQIGGSWKTILASGMGGGAQGVFALDVTAPGSFNEGNVLFEFTDRDDPDMGSVLGRPKIVKMKMAGTTNYKWFVVVGSGYNNYVNDGYYSSTGRQALFFLSLDKSPGAAWAEGTNYYKVVLADPVSTTVATGLANPGYAQGYFGEGTIFYAGDLHGNMWRFDFTDGLSNAKAANSVKKVSGTSVPMFIAKDSGGTRQPITTTPQVMNGYVKGKMVVFGTGKFLEPSDSDSTASQTMYGVWDGFSSALSDFQVDRSKLYQRSMVISGTTTTLTGSDTFPFGDGSSGTYRGWYFNLPTLRERVAVETAKVGDIALVNTAIPAGGCSGDGAGRQMCVTGMYGLKSCDFEMSQTGIPSSASYVNVEDVSAYDTYSARNATGRRMTQLQGVSLTHTTKITDAGNSTTSSTKVTAPAIPSGRMGWREVRNFRAN